MIHAYGRPDPPVPRLLEALAARGHAVGAAGAGGEPRGEATLVLGPGNELDSLSLGVLLGAWRSAPRARVLVLSRLGAHPDARAARLRWMWQLEEHARASGLPVLTLRLGPLLGPRSPLWLKLRERPLLGSRGRKLLNPVAESDVVETLDRALAGRAAWEGWYEVAGPEVLSLDELASLARDAGPALRGNGGAWEPAWRELSEHRLAEAGGWLEHFSIAVRPLAEQAREWA
ncbi:MAG TPA: hypothetical protein VGK89_12090 [Candidatus Eisenbacteria bacterium]